MKFNGNNVLKQMALFIFMHLQNWGRNRAWYGTQSKVNRSDGFPNRVRSTITSGFLYCIGHGESFATHYRE